MSGSLCSSLNRSSDIRKRAFSELKSFLKGTRTAGQSSSAGAESAFSSLELDEVDLLMLPEMAFSGASRFILLVQQSLYAQQGTASARERTSSRSWKLMTVRQYSGPRGQVRHVSFFATSLVL